MAIEFKPGVYYLAIWFIPFHNADVLGAVWKDETPGADWEAKYRFRYYLSTEEDSAWDGDDKKNWYCMRIKGDMPEEEVFEKMSSVFHLMTVVHPDTHKWLGEFFEGKIQADYLKAFDWLEKQPWAHMKKGSEVEAWEKEMDQKSQAKEAVAAAEKEAGWKEDRREDR